jgi:hypothetical protein
LPGGFVVTSITGKEAQRCDILANDDFANRSDSYSISFCRMEISLSATFFQRNRVADRPDRYEPRAWKGCQQKFAYLRKPRAQAKREMAKGLTMIEVPFVRPADALNDLWAERAGPIDHRREREERELAQFRRRPWRPRTAGETPAPACRATTRRENRSDEWPAGAACCRPGPARSRTSGPPRRP